MVRSPQVRSFSLRNYTLKINSCRLKKGKKLLSIERVAKELINEKGSDLESVLINLK